MIVALPIEISVREFISKLFAFTRFLEIRIIELY